MTTIYNRNNPPVIGQAWNFGFSLISQGDTKLFLITGVAFQAGDITVYGNETSLGNITSLPSGSNGVYTLFLSASEMNYNRVEVRFRDLAGSAWCDLSVFIETVSTGTVASPGDLMGLTTGSVNSASWDSTASQELDQYLSANHVTGSWATATGFPTVTDIDTQLSSSHGTGSWVTAVALTLADILGATVPDGYASNTVGYNVGRLGSGQINTISPVAQGGNVFTYRGDSYYIIDGRLISWTDISAGWPALTGSSIVIDIGGDVEFSGIIVNPTGSNKQVGVELSEAQTLTIPETNDYGLDFVVRATLANTHIVTLVAGKWYSKKKIVVGS